MSRSVSYKQCVYVAMRDVTFLTSLFGVDYLFRNYYLAKTKLPLEETGGNMLCLARRVAPTSLASSVLFQTSAHPSPTAFMDTIRNVKAIIIDPRTGHRLAVRVIGVAGDSVIDQPFHGLSDDNFDIPSSVVPRNCIWVCPPHPTSAHSGALMAPSHYADYMKNFVYVPPPRQENSRHLDAGREPSYFIHASHVEGTIVASYTKRSTDS
ncbi:hypothetical protein XU18_4740 [Perkinsela sp. CCAP 1560/4]|nr:hypothetical protein XU18_4740 [Perkinsela sp. CCAP 1560/4]|eukprot:KNH03932.1 hypothetical protein XU18_4740 [Perkinsela sp. CCAP 1560/4]